MSEKPGEYVGKDGRTYRWFEQAGTFTHQVQKGNTQLQAGFFWVDVAPASENLEAAVAALNAAAEAEEWVEMSWGEVAARIRPNGDSPEWRMVMGVTWQPELASAPWVRAYRAGLAQGRKALGEDVEELCYEVTNMEGYGVMVSGALTFAKVRLDIYQRIVSLAAKVRGGE